MVLELLRLGDEINQRDFSQEIFQDMTTWKDCPSRLMPVSELRPLAKVKN
jgi:hypothetical protein